jgi:TPR repeat protein
LKLLKEFVDTYKESRFLQSAQVQLERAAITDAITQKNPVQIETAIGDAQFRVDQAKALDGDKDAAFRVAQMFERGTNGVPRDEKRRVQWLRHASELKNGIASYQLYLYFVERGIDREAVRYENRAREQGYEPPPRLASVR